MKSTQLIKIIEKLQKKADNIKKNKTGTSYAFELGVVQGINYTIRILKKELPKKKGEKS